MAHVLLVDDDPFVLRGYSRLLSRAGHNVEATASALAALELIRRTSFDAVISDIMMPEMGGLAFVRALRKHDHAVPVLFMTAAPEVETAAAAIELGAIRYFIKPTPIEDLIAGLALAVSLRRGIAIHSPELEGGFQRALGRIWMAYQPIVDHASGATWAHEALVRSDEPNFFDPGSLFAAAERLGRIHELGREIRATVAEDADRLPSRIFVNLHPADLLDDELFKPDAPLSRIASRVTLEITERSSLESIEGLTDRLAQLRRLGYQIALDDLGAGYAGLAAFALLEPEVVKVDMALTRDVVGTPTKQKLIASIASLCEDTGRKMVLEGVETAKQRDELVRLGATLLQGYLYGRPARLPKDVGWGAAAVAPEASATG